MDFDVNEYLARHFPDVLPGAAYNLLAEGTKRTALRNVRILDRWLNRAAIAEPDTVRQLTPELLVAFMLYRVAGERLSTDIHSGSVALGTFLQSDLNPMLKLLRHQDRIAFSCDEFKQSQYYRDALITCRKRRGEVTVFSSARPIYPQDEARLRSCLTMDTASKRDEALIVLGLRSGFRIQSLSLIRLDLHVYELSADTLEIIIPGCKTTRF